MASTILYETDNCCGDRLAIEVAPLSQGFGNAMKDRCFNRGKNRGKSTTSDYSFSI